MFTMAQDSHNRNYVFCSTCERSTEAGKISPILCPFCAELMPDGYSLLKYTHERALYHTDEDMFK